MVVLQFGLAWVGAFVLGSFVEYWVHRLMHVNARIGKRHRDHHRRNEGQGAIPEFKDYIVGTLIFMPWLYLVSVTAGTGWLLGALSYALFSAYAHQLQHENPVKCFWMRGLPVHYVHHKYNMWHHNFGLALDWWDHVFGTYQQVDWETEAETAKSHLGQFQIRWW